MHGKACSYTDYLCVKKKITVIVRHTIEMAHPMYETICSAFSSASEILSSCKRSILVHCMHENDKQCTRMINNAWMRYGNLDVILLLNALLDIARYTRVC